ncbi:prenyltransferase [Sporosalibacterium faouarense]|uniref:prenyltransferase n=1 Tax=Sporosalibacterium faouarense TaxID=516123 RepID=UPI00141C4A8E|nr:prenyltransferase [Sporosalibacterium faouarense]MTI46946.1 prenyltransferase [Bacillota bacterium]
MSNEASFKRDSAYFKKLVKDLWIAFRPLSLTLAVGSTTLGIMAAYRKGLMSNDTLPHVIIKIVLITVAGILAQGGANLINDYFEGSFRYYRPSGRKIVFLGAERTYFDVLVFLWGMTCFGGAALIGLYLIYITNINMLFIGLIGVVGAYAYTGEPFVYKRHGLGVPLSFILMGPLMIFGAYFPFSLEFSWYPILIGLPPAFFIPALMISNEMRDFTRDTRLSLGTLSVRIGSKLSKYLYRFLVFGAFTLTILYIIVGLYPLASSLVFLTFPLALKAHKCVSSFEGLGIPYTNNLHWTFHLIIIISLFF